MKDISLYECPYSHIEKEFDHNLNSPNGYENTYSIWCPCGFRAPVFYYDPEQLGLKLRTDKETPKNCPCCNQLPQIDENASSTTIWCSCGISVTEHHLLPDKRIEKLISIWNKRPT